MRGEVLRPQTAISWPLAIGATCHSLLAREPSNLEEKETALSLKIKQRILRPALLRGEGVEKEVSWGWPGGEALTVTLRSPRALASGPLLLAEKPGQVVAEGTPPNPLRRERRDFLLCENICMNIKRFNNWDINRTYTYIFEEFICKDR